MIKPTLIDLNPVELNYYPSMISLDNYKGCCNAVDNFSTELYVPDETKDRDVKVFNMIRKMKEKY